MSDGIDIHLFYEKSIGFLSKVPLSFCLSHSLTHSFLFFFDLFFLVGFIACFLDELINIPFISNWMQFAELTSASEPSFYWLNVLLEQLAVWWVWNQMSLIWFECGRLAQRKTGPETAAMSWEIEENYKDPIRKYRKMASIESAKGPIKNRSRLMANSTETRLKLDWNSTIFTAIQSKTRPENNSWNHPWSGENNKPKIWQQQKQKKEMGSESKKIKNGSKINFDPLRNWGPKNDPQWTMDPTEQQPKTAHYLAINLTR